MVRGADYAFTFTVKNKTTGLPITGPELVNDFDLVLRSSASRVSLIRYSINSGVEALGDGKYKVTIPAADTLLLPTSGRAFLEGFTLPVRKSIKIDLGSISDNQANYPVDGE